MTGKPDSSRLRRPKGLAPEHIRAAGPGKTLAGLIDCFGRVFPLRSRTRVGRDLESVDIAILDDAVSSVHAEIVNDRGGWRVLDRGSMNGTFVQGRRIHGSCALFDSDVLSFADVSFIFVEDHTS